MTRAVQPFAVGRVFIIDPDVSSRVALGPVTIVPVTIVVWWDDEAGQAPP